MTRRFLRRQSYEVALEIKSDDFIRPPRDAQRTWLLNRALAEFDQNLAVLHDLAQDFVPGAAGWSFADRTHAAVPDSEIMEDWQIPLVAAMAKLVTEGQGDVLEIGFGRGVASDLIQAQAPRSHTIIECNEFILRRFDAWKAKYPGSDIRLVPGLWQEVLGSLGRFEGIFFHTYPLNEEEFLEQIAESVTFAEHFFPHAAAHLQEAGVFTYLSNEIDSLGRPHQRALFRHFRTIELTPVTSLELPENIRDAWWSDSMVVVKAVK